MNYYELTLEDEFRIEHYRKKWRLFRVITRLFCLHFWKRNGIYGTDDIWTCCKCGKNYYQNVTFNSPPISYIGDDMNEFTENYKYCNHHHEIGERHEMVDFGDGQFVANKEAIPLLKALNEIGLKTRSHHINDKEHAWVCILLDNAEIEVKEVFERDANRTKYNGKKELLIRWRK